MPKHQTEEDNIIARSYRDHTPTTHTSPLLDSGKTLGLGLF